jgi:hypothetical protein
MHWDLDSFVYIDENFYYQNPDKPMEGWFRSWEALRKLTGLRRLHINLEYQRRTWDGATHKTWNENGVETLCKVKDITAPRDFVIFLPDRRCTTDIDVGNPRCILKLHPLSDRRRYPFMNIP